MKNNTVFVTHSLGYGNNLLYWDGIFKSIADHNCKLTVLNRRFDKNYSGYVCLKKGLSFYNLRMHIYGSLYKYSLNFISPSLLIVLFKMRPNKLVISEFSLIGLYAIFYGFFVKCKIILLIENDPKFTQKSHTRLRVTIRKWLARRVDAVNVNNFKGYSYCMEVLSVPGERISIRPYITSELLCAKNYKKGSGLTFLMVGQLVERKGVLNFLNIFASYVQENLEQDLRLIIVGSGKQQSRITDLICQLKMNRYVELIGQVPYWDLGDVFAKADVFVNMTLGDYRSLVGFEALSAGLPILYSKYDGALEEVIDHSKNGYIIDPYDSKDVYSAIDLLVQNPDKLKEFSIHSREKASEYSFKRIASNWVEIINDF